MSEIRIRNKVWLEIDGQPLLGDGGEGSMLDDDLLPGQGTRLDVQQ